MKNEKKHTLFLDRDGVINVLRVGDYVKRIEELEFRDDFLKSIPYIVQKFSPIIIVTNQQGIAKGICTQEQVDNVHAYVYKTLLSKGLKIDKIYVCPHIAGGGCHCRKPETGMAEQAQADFPEIEFGRSVMIGDNVTDMIFGHRCGMETVFIGEINEENREEIIANSDHLVSSVLEFVKNY